ncbi:hypothetical protein KI387_002484, partial [Taxus chinensis]
IYKIYALCTACRLEKELGFRGYNTRSKLIISPSSSNDEKEKHSEAFGILVCYGGGD